MDGRPNETGHVLFLGKFKNNKKYKEQILQEIIAAICAMLNSNGGKVVIHFETDSSIPSIEGIPFSQMSLVIRILEQYMISISGLQQTVSEINFKDYTDGIIIIINKADSLITINSNLYLPSVTQVVEVSPLEPLEKIKKIIYRKVILNPVQLGSHCQIFHKDENCGFHENKMCQLKNLKADQLKRTTLADRMTSKGNKCSCYVSAFANHRGGHIYYGIKDDVGVVEGEFIPNEKDNGEIIKKVEKTINKMIWPEHIGQPKRGEHWEIFFEPVVDENSKPVPSTFVIVIYIAPCLGGVFTEQPECYEMVEGEVTKMSFDTWKKRISPPVGVRSKEVIPHSVQRITWTSVAARSAFTVGSERLRELINYGNWNAISEVCQRLLKQYHFCAEIELLVLTRQVTAYYRTGRFNDARAFLDEYMTILPQVRDVLIFEVVGLHLQAALKRATGDFDGLKEALTGALSKAELIEPGYVTATVYAFAATVSDLIKSEERLTNKLSPDILSMRALEHSRHVEDCPRFHADIAQKVHITLATFYLGCNLSGQPIKDNIDTSDIDKAKTSIMAVHQSTCEGNPLSWYREIQLNLVQSIYNYRHSQVSRLDLRVYFLRNAFNYAKKAECLARDYHFMEMVEWSKANEALCTEELVRAKFGIYKS